MAKEKKADKAKDGKQLSNQLHELKYEAKKEGVSKKDVVLAKEKAGSTARKMVESKIKPKK